MLITSVSESKKGCLKESTLLKEGPCFLFYISNLDLSSIHAVTVN